jgi:hypothetical protein
MKETRNAYKNFSDETTWKVISSLPLPYITYSTRDFLLRVISNIFHQQCHALSCRVWYIHNMPFSYIALILVTVNDAAGFCYTRHIIKATIVLLETMSLSSTGMTTCSVLLRSLLQPHTSPPSKKKNTHLINRHTSWLHEPLCLFLIGIPNILFSSLFTATIPFLIQCYAKPQYNNYPKNLPARFEGLTARFLRIQVYWNMMLSLCNWFLTFWGKIVPLYSRVKKSQKTSWLLKRKELLIFEKLGTTHPQTQHYVLEDVNPNISIYLPQYWIHLSPVQWHKSGWMKFTFQKGRIFLFVQLSKLTMGFFHQERSGKDIMKHVSCLPTSKVQSALNITFILYIHTAWCLGENLQFASGQLVFKFSNHDKLFFTPLSQ